MPKAKLWPSKIITIYEDRVSQSVRERYMGKINRQSLHLITNINNAMKDTIGNVLRQGIEEGSSVAALGSKLLATGIDKGVFRSARRRAYLIARTELHRARQQAAMDVYRANGIKLVKWVAIGDSRICPICQGREGRVFRIERVSEDWLPPIHPRCRCRVVPSNFDISINVKHSRRGKVVETKISPSPTDYLYIVRLKKAMEIIEKSNHEYSSTQVNLPKYLTEKVLALVKKVNSEDLHPTEKQDDAPHITVLYGLHKNSPKPVKDLLESIGSIKASISVMDIFQPEGRDYDVLVHRIDSPELSQLNLLLKQLPFSSDFSFYSPHITICYLKRGAGQKYINSASGLEGLPIEFNNIIFSSKGGKKTSIELKKDKPVPVNSRYYDLENGLIKVEKAVSVKGYLRTRKGKQERVRPFQRKKLKEEIKDLVREDRESLEGVSKETYDRWATGFRSEKERQNYLKQKKVDPEQEAALRRLFAKSILEKFIGMPNTPEVREEIKNEVLKAIQVKGFLRTRKGKREWVKPHHRQADELEGKIPEVGETVIPFSEEEKKIAYENLSKLPITKETEEGFGHGEVELKDIGFNYPGILFGWGKKSPENYTKIKNISTDEIYASQKKIPIEDSKYWKGAKNYIVSLSLEPPLVIEYEGKLYAQDHTRIAVQMLAGRKEIVAKVAKFKKGPTGEAIPVRQEKIPEVEGVEYVGVQEVSKEDRAEMGHGDFYLFNETKSGSTFSTKDLSKESIVEGRDRTRKRFEKSRFVLDLRKSRTQLVEFRKSKIIGKLIPHKIGKKTYWAKALEDGLVIKEPKLAKVGSEVLVKSGIAEVTAVGKDGIIARDDSGKKLQILNKDIKLWLKK